MTKLNIKNLALKVNHIKPSLLEYLEREEQGDAELFADEFTGKVVYDHAARSWYLSQGHYWEQDRTDEVTRLVGDQIAALYISEAKKEREQSRKESSKVYLDRAKKLLTRKRIANVLDLAQSRPGLKISGNEWDRTKMIIACKNGVVDLKTGKLRTSRPDEYIKAHTDIDWQGIDCPAPQWEKFLKSIFKNDTTMIDFMQRLFGYGITGSSTERVLPFLWGSGSNGKTILIEVIREVLGDNLCHKTSMDVFMDTRRNNGEGPKPALLKFRGMRIIYANESKDGQMIDTGIIKDFTGNDSITVRGLHTNPVTFPPTWLIMLITNHKPRLPSDDQAAWDRVMLIEFSERFVDHPTNKNEHLRDKNIKEKLLQESPGILAWLVKGCLSWQRNGLCPPEQVSLATNEYRHEEDVLGHYVSERLFKTDIGTIKASLIYENYNQWARSNGLEPLGSINFYRRIKRHLGEPIHQNDGNYYHVEVAKS